MEVLKVFPAAGDAQLSAGFLPLFPLLWALWCHRGCRRWASLRAHWVEVVQASAPAHAVGLWGSGGIREPCNVVLNGTQCPWVTDGAQHGAELVQWGAEVTRFGHPGRGVGVCMQAAILGQLQEPPIHWDFFFPPLTNASAFSFISCPVCPSPLKLWCLPSCLPECPSHLVTRGSYAGICEETSTAGSVRGVTLTAWLGPGPCSVSVLLTWAAHGVLLLWGYMGQNRVGGTRKSLSSSLKVMMLNSIPKKQGCIPHPALRGGCRRCRRCSEELLTAFPEGC